MTGEKVILRAIVRGKVQGVGFRYTTRAEASRRGIFGTVRNLSDGAVEIYLQGSRDDVEALLGWLMSSEGPGRVDSVDKCFVTGYLFSGFQIL